MRERKIDRLFRRYRRRGDVEALGAAFDLAAPELLHVARHLCPGEAEAEDAVQACFLTALERAGEHDGDRRVIPWLLGILANHARSSRRVAARRPDPARLTEGRVVDPVQAAGESELSGAVARAIEDVPETYREALRLNLVQGLGAREIASALGLSPGNARVRLHRGLQRLRRVLPAGFAAGLAASVTPARGLAAVRANVVAAGRAAAPMTQAAASAGLGGALASGRIAWAGGAVLALGLGGVWMRSAVAPTPEPAGGDDEVVRLVKTVASTPDLASSPELVALDRRDDVRTSLAVSPKTIHFSGRVRDYFDSTLDVPGARVWTLPDGADERVLRCEADALGRFAFDAPATEEDTIFIDAPGYAPFRAPVSAHARERYWESHGRQVWKGGAHISLGLIELERGVRLSGRATFEDGTAAVGAELFFMWDGTSSYSLLPMAEAAVGETTQEGAFHLDGRIPQRHRTGEGNELLVGILDDAIGCVRFAALEGRDRIDELELVLRRGPAFEVCVRSEGERPVAGARVSVDHRRWGTLFGRVRKDHSARYLVPAAIERFFVAHTDERGVATFAALPVFDRTGKRTAGGLFLDVRTRASGFFVDQRVKHLAAGGLEHLNVLLTEERSLRLFGRVVDARDDALARASVEVAGEAAVTGDDGRWEIALPLGLPYDRVGSVVLRADGFVAWEVSPLMLPESRDVDVGTVRLGRPTHIRGRVLDDRGEPVSGARIHFVDRVGQPTGVLIPRSAEDGTFVCEAVPEGEAVLGAVLYNDANELESVSQHVRARGGDTNVELVLPLEAKRDASLIADIVDAQTGATLDPLLAGLRRADPDDHARLPRTELAAGLVSASGLAPGSYQLWVHVQDRPVALVAFEVGADTADVRLDVAVARAGLLRGQLLTGSAQDLTRAYFRIERVLTNGGLDPGMLHPDLTAGQRSRSADPSGAFRIEDLTPGAWRLFVRCGMELAGPVDFDIEPGVTTELEVRLETGARLRVDFADCPDVTHPSITVWTAAGRESMGYMLFGDRSALFVVPPGRVEYEVELTYRAAAPAVRGVVELAAGEEHRVSCRDG